MSDIPGKNGLIIFILKSNGNLIVNVHFYAKKKKLIKIFFIQFLLFDVLTVTGEKGLRKSPLCIEEEGRRRSIMCQVCEKWNLTLYIIFYYLKFFPCFERVSCFFMRAQRVELLIWEFFPKKCPSSQPKERRGGHPHPPSSKGKGIFVFFIFFLFKGRKANTRIR